MSRFIKIAEINSIPEKTGIRFRYEDEDMAIFKINDEVFVVSNICPHNHTPSLYQGILTTESITCPYHSWEFNLRNGKNSEGFKSLKVYETKIENGFLYVKI